MYSYMDYEEEGTVDEEDVGDHDVCCCIPSLSPMLLLHQTLYGLQCSETTDCSLECDRFMICTLNSLLPSLTFTSLSSTKNVN